MSLADSLNLEYEDEGDLMDVLISEKLIKMRCVVMAEENNYGKIEGYREIHDWFLRHGGSNEDGRLSRNFNWADQDWLDTQLESWKPPSDSRMNSASSLSLIKEGSSS